MQNLIKSNRIVIEQIERTIREFRKQNYFEGNLQVKKVYQLFESVLDLILANKDIFNEQEEMVSDSDWMAVIEETMRAQQCEDYVLLADLLEINWLPRLLKIQMHLIMYLTNGTGVVADCQNAGKTYVIEYTSAGAYTLKVISEGKEYYLHSNHNPYGEGMYFADAYADAKIDTYLVFGLGLGYHVQALALKNPQADIQVFENDEAVFRLADEFGAIDLAEPEYQNVTIHADYTFEQLRRALGKVDESTAFLVHIPSLNNVSDPLVKEKIEEYFINISSIRNQQKFLDYNFKKNVEAGDENADTLQPQLKGQTAVLVARGPSLNGDLQALKRISGEVVILAVYSAAELLLKNGIVPDYLVFSDPQTQIHNEVKNAGIHDIPLIYLSTAANNVVRSHKGKHYIAYQEDYAGAEELAGQENHMLFSSGGSVSTLILDICIRLGCSKVICLGLDLAYINHQSHAAGTAGIRVEDVSDFRTVMDVHGEPISTRKNLDIYRKWIERRIEGIRDVEFINGSDGAFIKGMKHYKVGRIGNILVYYGDSSYQSAGVFASHLIEGWEKMGYQVVAIRADEPEVEKKLMRASNLDYDFIFFLNGVMADLVYEDGTLVQNNFSAPCISMFFEHPLYYSARLKSELHRFYALFVDENHVEYAKRFYPNLTAVKMLPQGGMRVESGRMVPYEKRHMDVLFTGSYENPEDIMEEIKQISGMGQVIIMNIIEQMISNTDVTIEKGLENFLEENGISLTDEEFRKYMELMAYADRYIRALYRNLVIMSLVKNNIKVHVFGTGWNKFKCGNPGNIILGGAVEAGSCMELMANAKMVLNVMPWHKKGSHERIYNAMLNGAVAVTDESTFLTKEFKDGHDIVFYSIKNISGLVKKIRYLLKHGDEAAGIAAAGYFAAKERHTWEHRAQEIALFAKEINQKEEK